MANFGVQGAIMGFDAINTQAKKAPHYKAVRAGGTLAYSLFTGFTPFNLIAVPFQIAGMIVMTIIFMFVFDFGFLSSILAAYITTGLIITGIAFVIINFVIDVVSPGDGGGNIAENMGPVHTANTTHTANNGAPNNIIAASHLIPKNNVRLNAALNAAQSFVH